MLLYYPDGTSVSIPDIDAQTWIQLHGLSPTPPDHSQPVAVVALAPSGKAAVSVINQAETVDDIATLPSIGKGSAKVILEARPEGGYESLEQVWQLCPAILSRPYNVNPETVAAYGNAP